MNEHVKPFTYQLRARLRRFRVLSEEMCIYITKKHEN